MSATSWTFTSSKSRISTPERRRFIVHSRTSAHAPSDSSATEEESSTHSEGEHFRRTPAASARWTFAPSRSRISTPERRFIAHARTSAQAPSAISAAEEESAPSSTRSESEASRDSAQDQQGESTTPTDRALPRPPTGGGVGPSREFPSTPRACLEMMCDGLPEQEKRLCDEEDPQRLTAPVLQLLKKRFHALSRVLHPDKGGDVAAFQSLNHCWNDLLSPRGSSSGASSSPDERSSGASSSSDEHSSGASSSSDEHGPRARSPSRTPSPQPTTSRETPPSSSPAPRPAATVPLDTLPPVPPPPLGSSRSGARPTAPPCIQELCRGEPSSCLSDRGLQLRRLAALKKVVRDAEACLFPQQERSRSRDGQTQLSPAPHSQPSRDEGRGRSRSPLRRAG